MSVRAYAAGPVTERVLSVPVMSLSADAGGCLTGEREREKPHSLWVEALPNIYLEDLLYKVGHSW